MFHPIAEAFGASTECLASDAICIESVCISQTKFPVRAEHYTDM